MAATDPRKPWLARVALPLLLGLLLSTQALADAASGTWTGDVELLGNYYWERSTRVIAPSLDVNLYAPNGLTLHGDYLIDTITSASQAAGALVDERFNEVRHDVSLALNYEFDRGERQLGLGGYGRYSTEPDYTSMSGGLRTELYLDDRATTLRFAVTGLHDEIRQVFRGGSGVRPGGDGVTTSDLFAEHMNAMSTRASWTQLLSRNAEAQLTLDFAYVGGYQANAYRTVSVNGTPTPENYPDQRFRYTVSGHLAYFVEASRTTVRLLYRAYYDSWKIGSLTPEVWIFQQLGANALGRIRYRYYTQTASFFHEADPANYPRPDGYLTGDAKMAAFHTHTLSFQLQLAFRFFENTSFDWLSRARLDLGFDYVWSTSGYGNAVISQAGIRVPF